MKYSGSFEVICEYDASEIADLTEDYVKSVVQPIVDKPEHPWRLGNEASLFVPGGDIRINAGGKSIHQSYEEIRHPLIQFLNTVDRDAEMYLKKNEEMLRERGLRAGPSDLRPRRLSAFLENVSPTTTANRPHAEDDKWHHDADRFLAEPFPRMAIATHAGVELTTLEDYEIPGETFKEARDFLTTQQGQRHAGNILSGPNSRLSVPAGALVVMRTMHRRRQDDILEAIPQQGIYRMLATADLT